jgi:outer membrane receptor for ferrienterochelin and colicins
MKRIIVLLGALVFAQSLLAQSNFRAVVKDSATLELLQGVTVSASNNSKASTVSNASGTVVLDNLAAGATVINFSYVGYKRRQLSITVPDTVTYTILMQQDETALQDVTVVASTRSNDPIENATTKVEVLGLEEMNEESTLKPGNIASILGDMSGIQIQQSSITSGNSNVRIQGLDGKYTQILRDGMPLYEGYSGGFGILTIPPLDLKQIELIKGAASTLYGGGAIGGLINLISKKPSFTPDASFMINQTTLKETNINAYYSQRWKSVGFTFFAGQNLQKEIDVDKDGFSDLPNTKSSLIHPTLFFYPSTKSYISVSWSGSFENRLGGDMLAIDGKRDAAHSYFEKNKLGRNTFTFMSENRFNNSITATLKASLSVFNRDETTNTYFFSARQTNFYSEASLTAHAGKHFIVGGLNVTGDVFKPSAATPAPVGKFSNTTQGAFVQDTWKLLESTKLETGLRLDHHNDYGNFVLPRIALFHHFSEAWGARLGYGMGYKTPNPLTPQIRDFDIYNIQPIASNVRAEKSTGANIEVNYKKEFGENNSFFINHAFFITTISDPIIAIEDVTGKVTFANQSKEIVTKGFDTYIQMELHSLELYLGYTYTHAQRKYLPRNTFMLLTPRHRAASVIAYEIEHKWRFGIEGSYTGQQHREDYSKTPAYLFIAAMLEKKLGPKWSIVLNCENLLDERQSKYESLYTGAITNPNFKALWAPVDGRVTNLSIRFKPFEKW